MAKTTLYKRGEHGINKWSIWSRGCTLHIEANGRRYEEEIPQGLGGRTLDQQVALRREARIRRKMDDGFKESVDQLGDYTTNQLGLHSPMLASPYKGGSCQGYFVQPKLDGHRCLINADGAYSRRGKPIESIHEILESTSKLPRGVTLDGELYHHGSPLQRIGSWVKRRQPKTAELQYCVYDIISPGISYVARLDLLQGLIAEMNDHRIMFLPTMELMADPMEMCLKYREEGYEGAILRNPRGLYGIGKRSKDLIKVKMRHDDEFECVDIETSRFGLGVLVLKTKNGSYFRTLAPGPVHIKKSIIAAKGEYIGRRVTCEYAELTEDQLPFHCVATRWLETL